MKSLLIAAAVVLPLVAWSQSRVDEMKGGYDREMDALIDRYYHEGDFEKVTELLQVYSKQHPDDVTISTNLAWMFFNIGNEPAAFMESYRFVRDNPNNELGKIQLAGQYFTRKIYARVPAILEPIIGKTKEMNAFVMLSRSYEELGMLKSALRVHEARMKIFPNDETGKRNLEKVKRLLSGGKN